MIYVWVCVQMSAVPQKARGGHWIPWSWSYRWMWPAQHRAGTQIHSKCSSLAPFSLNKTKQNKTKIETSIAARVIKSGKGPATQALLMHSIYWLIAKDSFFKFEFWSQKGTKAIKGYGMKSSLAHPERRAHIRKKQNKPHSHIPTKLPTVESICWDSELRIWGDFTTCFFCYLFWK